MGSGMCANLAQAGHQVRAFDLNAEAVAKAVVHRCRCGDHYCAMRSRCSLRHHHATRGQACAFGVLRR